ncbi:tyrosine-type recombinase/integrase [Nocardia huaxiensis]|uniref:tyrosine-type recombinase/integrase n=1 Tax=Nocardia huaxiensis TaxID=2755382 RepID=UPI003B8A5F6F
MGSNETRQCSTVRRAPQRSNLRRHSLRHAGPTWFADAGVSEHLLQDIAGHSDPRVTKLYLHPGAAALQQAGNRLSLHLAAPKRPPSPLGQVNRNPSDRGRRDFLGRADRI